MDTKRLDKALERLQKIAGTGSLYAVRLAAEQEYRAAYDELVRKGLRPKLRSKYRVGA